MRARGFTLIEMMAVVAIVGLMSALAAFSMQQTMVQGRVSSEIRRTMSRVQQARALSVSTGQCYGVMIGGPQSNTQVAGGPVRNRIMTFRKPAADTACNDFDPMTDMLLTREFIGAEGNTADTTRNDLVWDVLLAAPTEDLKIIFRGDDARPRVMLGTTEQLPNPGPPERHFLQLRSTRYDVSPGNPVNNPTRRRLEISPTGTSMISVCASGPNVLPCIP